MVLRMLVTGRESGLFHLVSGENEPRRDPAGFVLRVESTGFEEEVSHVGDIFSTLTNPDFPKLIRDFAELQEIPG